MNDITLESKRKAQWIIGNCFFTGVKTCCSCQHFKKDDEDDESKQLLGKCKKAMEDGLDDDAYVTPLDRCKNYALSPAYGRCSNQEPQDEMMEWVNRVNRQHEPERFFNPSFSACPWAGRCG